MALKPGDKVPDFRLQDQNGEDFHLADHLGSKPLVIFFYPKDNTPGCIKEVCSFRDSYQDFTDLGAEVIGISSDSVNSHKKFANSYRLPFKILADKRGAVRKLFQVPSNLFGLLPGRVTYIVDKKGAICYVYNNARAAAHHKVALQTLEKSIE